MKQAINTMQFVSTIFRKVADALYDGASAVGITYNEINILVYYLLIPLIWTIMFDCWLGTLIMTYALVSIILSFGNLSFLFASRQKNK